MIAAFGAFAVNWGIFMKTSRITEGRSALGAAFARFAWIGWLGSLAVGFAPQAKAGPSELTRASDASGAGSVTVLKGSVLALVGAGVLVVSSVEVVADGVIVVLHGASTAAEVSIKVSGKAAAGASQALGKTVQVSALASGTMLVLAGQVLAFVPNEVGKALLHHGKVVQRGLS